jgi:hypothetical protein
MRSSASCSITTRLASQPRRWDVFDDRLARLLRIAQDRGVDL